jgi:hypothetical protein
MLGIHQARIDLAEHTEREDTELVRTLVNASSLAEAGFALSLLRDTVPERALLNALNLREVLTELPAAPFVMALDAATLANVLGLERDRSSYVLQGDGFRVDVLAEGNFCFDIVLKRAETSAFLKTSPVGEDIVRPAAYEMLMETDGMLEAVIEVVKAMGLVYNPRLYFTVDEWLAENSVDTMSELWDAFRRADA